MKKLSKKNPNLTSYRVMLHEEKGDKFTIAFDCQAEDDDHAVEQAQDAYPGCEIVSSLPFDDGEKAYVVYSQSESALNNNGAGFWSNTEGWTTIDGATRFSFEEKSSLNLPMATGLDAQWVLASEMQEVKSSQPEQFYADEAGKLFQVLSTSTAETVEFAPQGGGIIRKAPRADFENRFKPATLPAFSLVAICAEWLPDDMKVPAYSNGRRWNGWAMPYFTIESGKSLLGFMPDLRYDSQRDAFVSKAYDDDQAEEEVFPAETLVIDGRPIQTYAIGAGFWCWEFSEPICETQKYIELEVTMRSKTTFGTDKTTIRVWDGQSAKEVAERIAQGYGAEVVEIRNLDGSIFEETASGAGNL